MATRPAADDAEPADDPPVRCCTSVAPGGPHPFHRGLGRTGTAVQPLVRQLVPTRTAVAALAAATVGPGMGALALATTSTALVFVAEVPLGAAYDVYSTRAAVVTSPVTALLPAGGPAALSAGWAVSRAPLLDRAESRGRTR